MSNKYPILPSPCISPRIGRSDAPCGCAANDVPVVASADRYCDDLLLVTRRAWFIDPGESR